MVAKIAELPVGSGYNAATGEYVNLIEAGVIDPVKVTRSAVVNAASIAGMVLTTATTVVDKSRRAPSRRRAARTATLVTPTEVGHRPPLNRTEGGDTGVSGRRSCALVPHGDRSSTERPVRSE